MVTAAAQCKKAQVSAAGLERREGGRNLSLSRINMFNAKPLSAPLVDCIAVVPWPNVTQDKTTPGMMQTVAITFMSIPQHCVCCCPLSSV
jgi:hypothetical protein